MPYKLFYWDGLQGRGEFIRLALEDAGADYIDVSRYEDQGGLGTAAMMDVLDSETEPQIPFAPPFLQDGKMIVSHVANILQYLGPKLGLVPQDEALRIWAHGLQLTITDLVAEVHDTHHPIATGAYYEDQKTEAKARAKDFLDNRLPKYVGYFERVLTRNPAGSTHSVGDATSYVDLSLFQVFESLRYAFPRATRNLPTRYPAMAALAERVGKRPNIASYLASDRRLAFNDSGIFRHYPELDQE